MSTAITYDELREGASFSCGLAVAAKSAKNALVIPFLLFGLHRGLRDFIGKLRTTDFDQFSPVQLIELRDGMQQLHASLIKLLSIKKRVAFYGGIEENTEDLRDFIEMMVLREDADFKSLISSCASSIGIG